MQRSNNRHRSATNPRRRVMDPMSSSTDTTASSSRGAGCGSGSRGGKGSSVNSQPPHQQQQQHQPRADNIKDFKERVDSTIQQLSGLVSLLSNKDAPVVAQPRNSSNRGDALLDMSRLGGSRPCCCKCHEGGCSQTSAVVPPPPSIQSAATAARRQARSSREFSAAISATPATAANSMLRRSMTTGDVSEVNSVSDAPKAPTVSRRKAVPPPVAPASPPQQYQQQQQQQQLQLLQPVTPKASTASGSVLRFLWYDSSHGRYAVRDAEIICAKTVKRLHISVHYFRVAGEDMLLLEKDCSDDGLAFLDTDSVVAFEGLSVEKLLVLQELGCQLRPEELSREFAVEKGRCKYYVVPVEDDNGNWRLCPSSGHHQLESLRRILEQQEARGSKKAA